MYIMCVCRALALSDECALDAMRPEMTGKALNTEVWMTVLSLQICE